MRKKEREGEFDDIRGQRSYQNCEFFRFFSMKKYDRDETWNYGGRGARRPSRKESGREKKDRSLIAGRSELKEFLRYDRVDAIRPKASSISSTVKKKTGR